MSDPERLEPIRRLRPVDPKNPYQLDVFPVKEGDTNQEQAIVSGDWGDFTDGRTPDAIEDLPAGTTMVAVIQDPDGPTVRYVRLGGGGLPPAGAQGTVLTAVTDNVWGIDYVRAVE